MAGIQKESDTSRVQCALCTPTSACFGIYCYCCYTTRESTANIAACHPYCLGYSWVTAVGTGMEILFRSHSPPSRGVEGAQLGYAWWSLDQGC